MVLFWERKRAPAFMEISQSANRGLGVQFKGVEFLPRDTTADADHKWQQPLIGRQHLPVQFQTPPRRQSDGQGAITMPNALYCELTYSFYIGQRLVFVMKIKSAIRCGNFVTSPPAIQSSHTALPENDFFLFVSRLCKIVSPCMRGRSVHGRGLHSITVR